MSDERPVQLIEAEAELMEAISAYSTVWDECEGNGAGLIDTAIVYLQKLKFDDDGDTTRMVDYIIPTPDVNPAALVGMTKLGLRLLVRNLEGEVSEE